MVSETNEGPVLGDKPDINIVLHWLSRFILWVMRWRVDGRVPRVPKLVVIAAPHTANLDGVLLVLTSWYLRVKVEWMVKAEWTRPIIIGWLVRAMGGIGIDRSASFNAVEVAVDKFKTRQKLALVVPPEGTRRKSDHWKTGFYWIAVGAGVPIFCGRLDYGRKVVDLTAEVIHPTGDIEADMEKIWDLYRGITAKHPEKVNTMRLRPGQK